ncbi:MAG: DUF4153 domain-containing protein [Clostridiales bacterium]|nr:DUF4153 domain-containing protein [Clostridiales bacterium]
MKQNKKILAGLEQLSGTITRFPLTILLLVLIALINGIEINNSFDQYSKLLFTFVLGVFISLVSQVIYERFFDNSGIRKLLMAGTIIITAGYYFIISSKDIFTTVFTIRMGAVWFVLLIAFLWIPTIKSSFSFNESFLALFKAFFLAVFYSSVLFIGVSLIIMAIDLLIVTVNGDTIPHVANLIFCIFATIYLLSNLPLFNYDKEGEVAQEQEIQVSVSKFLKNLISYVIIPITAVFTLVLLLYVIMNITGKFWTDNMLEPMLVSYSITVIIVYLLASNIQNNFANIFRNLFPKVLVPIVLFQTIASVLKIGEAGFTHGRYYAILFGVFATIAGILFCFVPVKKNGLIAPILIVLSLLSIVPPVDAFTVSRKSQIRRLEDTLMRNNMLQDGKLSPNTSIVETDREIIISSVQYLNIMGYTEDIVWLSSYANNKDFEKEFGFPQYDYISKDDNTIYLHRESNAVPITGYDIMLHTNLYFSPDEREIGNFVKDDRSYRLVLQNQADDKHSILLFNEENMELLAFDIQEIVDRAITLHEEMESLTLEQASFTQENDVARMTLVVENIHINNYTGSMDEKYVDINTYILVTLK